MFPVFPLAYNLFLDLLMLGLLFAPLAILVELNLFCDEFFVLAGPVVYALACSTAKFYESIL